MKLPWVYLQASNNHVGLSCVQDLLVLVRASLTLSMQQNPQQAHWTTVDKSNLTIACATQLSRSSCSLFSGDQRSHPMHCM